MWDPVTGLYVPTYQDLFNVARERGSFNLFWTAEDEMALSIEIYDVWIELISNLETWEKEEFDDPAYWVEDEEEFEEEDAFDDLTYGIDNVLEFDFENDFYFTKYDHIFYYLTLYFLILNAIFF